MGEREKEVPGDFEKRGSELITLTADALLEAVRKRASAEVIAHHRSCGKN